MLDEDLLKQVNEITKTYYINNEDLKDLAESIIEDLIIEIEHRDEEIENIIQDRNDNYEQISIERML